MKFVFNRIKSIRKKNFKENKGYQHSLLFSYFLKKLYFLRSYIAWIDDIGVNNLDFIILKAFLDSSRDVELSSKG